MLARRWVLRQVPPSAEVPRQWVERRMLARRWVLRRVPPSAEVPRRWVVAAAEARWDLEAPPSPQRQPSSEC